MRVEYHKYTTSLQKIRNSNVIWIITTCFTLINIAANIYSLLYTSKQFAYQIESAKLLSVQQLPKDTTLNYKGIPIVSDFFSTIVTITNIGKDVIKNSDIAKIAPLSIHIDNPASVLGITILETSNVVNDFSHIWKPGEANIALKFDFTNPKDFLKIQIIHTQIIKNTVNVEIIGNPKSGIISQSSNDEKWNYIYSVLTLLTLFTSYFVMQKLPTKGHPILERLAGEDWNMTYTVAGLVIIMLSIANTVLSLFSLL